MYRIIAARGVEGRQKREGTPPYSIRLSDESCSSLVDNKADKKGFNFEGGIFTVK